MPATGVESFNGLLMICVESKRTPQYQENSWYQVSSKIRKEGD